MHEGQSDAYLDSVLYQGDAPLAGATNAIGRVRGQGVPHLFPTNTSPRPRAAVTDRLGRLDIQVSESQIPKPPAPACFDAAVAAVGSSPGQTLMIGEDAAPIGARSGWSKSESLPWRFRLMPSGL